MMVLDHVGDQEAILYAQLGQQPLVRTTQTSLEPRLGTLPHETKRSSDALKDPSIRRAVSTLVYATPLHPAQRHLPVNLHPPNSAVLGAGGLAGACRRRPCWSKMNRQDDHPRGCTAGPSRTRPPSGLPPPSSSWRCPSTPPRPTSWWQQQRSVVLTQRAGLLFTSGDESFCTCLEHRWNFMMLCSLMRMARLVTLQPVLSVLEDFLRCVRVCCRVSTGESFKRVQ
jgi:hypothetical protein